jgi:hypothetical protein
VPKRKQIRQSNASESAGNRTIPLRAKTGFDSNLILRISLNLQIGGGSLIITGLFGLMKRFCGIDSINDVNL